MRIFISSEEPVTERLQGLMGKAKSLVCPDVSMEFSDNTEAIHDKATVLALGPYKRRGTERVVQLPSGKALLTRADSVTRLKTAFRLLVDPPVLEPMNWRLYTEEADVDELLAILYACRNRPMVVDIETSGDVDADLPSPSRLLSVGIFGGQSAMVIGEGLLRNKRVLWALDEFLENNTIITVNGKFDLKYFPNAKVKRHFDVMLAHYSLFPAAGAHGLKDMAKTYFGADDWDSPNKKYTVKATYDKAEMFEDGSYHEARSYSTGSGYERIPKMMMYEYNCIAEGQLVLTDKGLIPIESVTLAHKLWDGVEWVTHEGVILKGTKSVIELDGLRVTPDHLLLTESGDYACAESIKQGDRRAVIGAHGTTAIRTPNFDRQHQEGDPSPSGRGTLRRLPADLLEEGEQPSTGVINNMPLQGYALGVRYESASAPSEVSRYGAALHAWNVCQQGAREQGYTSAFPQQRAFHRLGAEASTSQRLHWCAVRPSGQQWRLRAGEPTLGNSPSECYEQEGQRTCAVHGTDGCSSALVASRENGHPNAERVPTGSSEGASTGRTTGGISREAKATRVFDILNAGPRYRYTVSGVIVSNCMDVYWTWHLYLMVKDYLEDDADATKLFEHLMRCSDDLYFPIEMRGITFDVPYMETLRGELTADLKTAHDNLKELAGRDLNYASYLQVGDYFVDAGVPLKFSKKNKQGKKTYHTDEKSINAWLEKWNDKEDLEQVKEVARQILVCRKIKKELGTYIIGYLANIHGSQGYPIYKLHASTTGRLGGGGPSMLTIPRDKRLKRMVVPSGPGRLIVGADLSQAELRVMAIESGDQWMLDAFGPDAGDIFDILLSAAIPNIDWAALHERASHGDDPDGFYENMRARMKGVVYGVSFGRGTPAIAAALKITIAEAQVLVDGFVRPGSDFALWRQEITNRAVGDDESRAKGIRTVFGRHFQSELITGANRQNVINSALAFTSQSTANDICLMAALMLVPQLAQYDAWMLGTIHDAIYTDAPEEHAEAVGKLTAACLREAGRQVYGDIIPFTADYKAGKSLAG